MRSLIKLAAAVVLAVSAAVVTLTLLRGGSTAAFAEVVQRIQSAHTMTADLTFERVGQPPLTIKAMFAGPGRYRFENADLVSVGDFDKKVVLSLNKQDKTAYVLRLDVSPPGTGAGDTASFRDWLEEFHKIGRNAGKPVGVSQINGRRAKGFVVMVGTEKLVVWADERTGAPIRAVILSQVNGKETPVATLDHIALNVDLPDALFSVDVPQGYAVKESGLKIGATPAGPRDLIDFLREFARRSGGNFPPAIGPDHWGEAIAAVLPPNNQKPTTRQTEELIEFSRSMGRATVFLAGLKGGWHYTGKDVRFGEAARPVFWYQPDHGATPKVIYGDLHTGEADPKDLPRK